MAAKFGRSVWAILLLFCIDYGVCQRKSSRNIPVGSDVKTGIHFDCPEEFGYYPHPTDCTQYYVCVFGGALLESCTGGLMYSHELQTCDWPRNVGCDGLSDVSVTVSGSNGDSGRQSSRVSVQVPIRERESQRVRYTVVSTQAPQPSPVVSSRGQSRQLQHQHAQEIISKQQLYADADDPAEEIESDRQQRVYRGQPSTVGQVQRDRDGLRHTNAIPTSSRGEKIGVISFGTQQQQQVQQPIQQYRNVTFYNIDSLTNDLTEIRRRRKRQIRHRLASIDVKSPGDSISWQSNRHVPHVLSYQPTKHTYHNHRQNLMDLQPPPSHSQLTETGFKPSFSTNKQQQQQPSDDQTEFVPIPPPYKKQTNVYHNLKNQPTYQYYNYNINKPFLNTQFPQHSDLIDNYSYFNLGGAVVTTPSSVGIIYASSNEQAKHTVPKPDYKYQNQFQSTRPQTSQYYTQHNPIAHTNIKHSPVQQNKTEQVHNKEEVHAEPDEEYTDDEEENEEINEEAIEDIKADYSPPSVFFKSVNKYENIENPFADPNFDFDKFISKLRGHTQNKQKQLKPKDTKLENDSIEKPLQTRTNPDHIRAPTNKPVNIKPESDEDYYYDDDEEIDESKTKNPLKHSYDTTPKPFQARQNYSQYRPINNNDEQLKTNPQVFVNDEYYPNQATAHRNEPRIKTVSHPTYKQNPVHKNEQRIKTSAPIPSYNDKKSKPPNEKPQNEKYEQELDDYEYYDDDDDYADSEEKRNIKDNREFPAKVTQPKVTNNSNSNLKYSTPNHQVDSNKVQPNIKNQNHNYNSQNKPPTTRIRPTMFESIIRINNDSSRNSDVRPSYYQKASSSKTTESMARVTTTIAPPRGTKYIRQHTMKPLTTSTTRPHKDATTTKTIYANNVQSSTRLEDVSTQSHLTGSSQPASSGRTLYNGSQQYDPAQYDPYYTLYEDDVELYRDVDYSQQQPQYTRGHQQTSPQHTYRGTPAPISHQEQQQTEQKEHVPHRDRTTAYSGYSAQPKDVYSTVQDYQDQDNYNVQVDDQQSYRQPSRQPIRGDRNELNYFLETSPTKSTTIRTTTTTTTTTTPRSIPVQKQNVVVPRSPLNAITNNTRPHSIIITLSINPGPKIPLNQTQLNVSNANTDHVQQNSSSEQPQLVSQLIHLKTGFSFRQTDGSQHTNLTPITYKPLVANTPSRIAVLNKPAPFSITNLPNANTKSVIFQLSSHLSHSHPNSDEIVSSTTELPFDIRFTASNKYGHIVPTTYSPPKSLRIASFIPRVPQFGSDSKFESATLVHKRVPFDTSYTDNKQLDTADKAPAKLQDIDYTQHSKQDYKKQTPVEITSTEDTLENGSYNRNKEQISVENNNNREQDTSTDETLASSKIENKHRYREHQNRNPFENVSTFNKESTEKVSSNIETTTSYYTQRNQEERIIISKIHFGSPETLSQKINNLALTTSNSAESLKTDDEPIHLYNNNNVNNRQASTTEYIISDRPHSRFSFGSNPTPTTERDQNQKYYSSDRYVKNYTTSEKPNDILITSTEKQIRPLYYREQHNVKSISDEPTTDKHIRPLYQRNFVSTESNTVKYTTSTAPTTTSTTVKITPNTAWTTEKYRTAYSDKRFNDNIKQYAAVEFERPIEQPVKITPSTVWTTEKYRPAFNDKRGQFNDNLKQYTTEYERKSTTEPTVKITPSTTWTTEKYHPVHNEKRTQFYDNLKHYTSTEFERKIYTTEPSIKVTPSTAWTTEKYRPSFNNKRTQFNDNLKHYTPTTEFERKPFTTTEESIKITPSTIWTTEKRPSYNVKQAGDKEKLRAQFNEHSLKHITTSTEQERIPFTTEQNERKPNTTSTEYVKTFSTSTEQQTDSFEVKDAVKIVETDSVPTYKKKAFQQLDVNVTSKTLATADPSHKITIPARLSRVNTAIKSLIAFGGSRRNSQTPKCNENQTTPDTKCNEIQKQRTSTRGRGSAHYTNAANGESIAVNVNRGTPAPRSRPTLKPSTSIVSKATEFIDIYKFPPTRPEAIYPQPQVDKTAAKCRKDVCLLPDCSCGGKEIPGDIPVEEVPQVVLITFDDAVNDLNKGIYSELFEVGRTNPNGCPISATFYVSHEWTDYSQVQNLYADGHELASHTVSHSFGEQFSQKKWNREVAGQREILSAYGGVRLEDVRGMRAPFLSVGGNKMFKMLYDSNFTYDSSLPVYENRPPSWPYTLDYKLFHDCMIPPCPTRSYPGVWEVPMVMWQDLNGGRCSMGDACSNPSESDGVYKMLMKNFERHYTTNRAPFGLFYHAAWFTQPHHKEGFIKFLDFLVSKNDVFMLTNWQAIQWVRDPTPLSRINSFQPFQCNYDRPKRCNNPKVCNLWHKSGVRYMKTCQPCPDIYPWTGKTGIRSSRIDNDIED